MGDVPGKDLPGLDLGAFRDWFVEQQPQVAGIRTLRFADGPDEVHQNALARAELRRQAMRRTARAAD
ncbi:hypothetical protein ncot_02160 [Nocardioides sp. JQ2195]|uniref:hypothetical protein n=1 Tax=Nocardioides sp. JQ2195 TaxID=2592334 RepID=UPI00143E90E1|nr:hypothetical protein [Nocardioides sp. JQ2195]QIX25141.1 hypothetical protein ncot_02160 [Nocardioides sp. JQ2195]